MCCVQHPPPRKWCPLVCCLSSCASAASASMLRSLLLPPSSSWLSTPALSAVEGLVFPRVVPVFSSPLWLSGWLSLLLSETSWVQQLNSGRLSQKSQLRKVPIVTTLVQLTPLYSESLIRFPRTCFPCLETRANTSQVTEPRLTSLALPSLSELCSGISVYFGALSDSLFLRDLYLCHPCA